MNYNETEKLYSPSLWSKRENVTEKHIEFAEKETEKNRKSIPCLLNIRYGDKPRQKFDFYGTDLLDDSAVFIFIHGGYWQELSKDNSGYVVKPFYNNKIKTFIIGYSLCPEVSLQDIVAEIRIGLRRCFEWIPPCSKGVYMSGYSAGSQLISYLFTSLFPLLIPEERSLLKGAILCCGIYDLTPLIDTYINKPLKLNYKEAKELSPMFKKVNYFQGMDFKIHVVVGEFDSPAFIEQSELYFKHIKQFTDASFKLIKDVDHFSIVEQYSNENYELVKFIIDLVQKQSTKKNYRYIHSE